MRIAVMGAGAVGCYLGARLADRGHAVTLVGRGDQVEAIAGGGLRLEDERGVRVYHLPAARALQGHPDLILLTVKTQDVTAACREVARGAPGVPVVVTQNGVRADHLAAAALGREPLLGAVLVCAATYLAPGSVSVQFHGWAIVGEPFGPTSARARRLARLLGEALPTYRTAHLRRVRWSKLVTNLNNALCAATGLPVGEIGRSPTGRLASLRAMREGYRVVRAAGIRLDHGRYALTPRALRAGPETALVALLQASLTPLLAGLPERAALAVLAGAGRSRLQRLPIRFSTWQSIARGKSSEIEFLNGEILQLGIRLGMPTPYNAHLVRLVRQVERTGAFVPLEALLPDQGAGEPALAGSRP